MQRMVRVWLVVGTLAAGAVMAGLHAQVAVEDVQVVRVSAERFAFTPSEVRVQTGRLVRIELRSEDTAHGFRILGTDIDVDIPKRSRGVAIVEFEPTEGTYTFECSHLCGAGHSFMRGSIIVSKGD